MFKKSLLCSILASGIAVPSISYAELFNITVTANDQSYSASFNDAVSSIEEFDADIIDSKLVGFDKDIDAATAVLNYRGLDMEFFYEENSTTLRLFIDGIVDEEFTGATRDDSSELLTDFLQSEGGGMLNAINKKLAEVSASDPVAGNPNSLMSTQVATVFESTMSDSNTGTTSESFDTDNKFDLGVRFGSYKVDGADVESIHLPLSYTFNFDSAPGHKLQLKLPISYSRTNQEAETYSLGAGIAYTYPVNENLSFTPGIAYGAVGSIELGSVAAIETISLTTRYDFQAFNHEWRFGNTLAKVRTLELDFGDYSINPELSNTIMVNGITWKSVPISWADIDVFFNDTRFFGDALYSERTNEIGFSVASNDDKPGFSDFKFRLGASYVFTDRDDIDGIKLNMGSAF